MLRHVFRPAVSRLEDRTLLATMIWTNPAGGDWDTASNWVNSGNPSDQHVPTASDDAVIDLANITVTHDSGSDSVNSITSQDPIVINGGSLAIASASTINSSLTLAFSSVTDLGGTMSVSGALAVNGLFTLGPRTTLSGGGTVDAYGGIKLSGRDVSVEGTTLNNHSAATWDVDGASDTFGDGAEINNLAGATFTAAGNFGGVVQGNGSFHNAGTFTASTAVGGDIDFDGPAFFNTGTFDQQGGEVELSSDGMTPNTGNLIGAANTVLVLADFVLAADSVVDTAGSVSMSSCMEDGSYRAAGATFATDTTFGGPVLDPGSSLEVSNREGGSVDFTPAVGGPVTLTTGALTIDADATLTGTDNFAVDGVLTISAPSTSPQTTLGVSGIVDAYGGINLSTGGGTGENVVIQGTRSITTLWRPGIWGVERSRSKTARRLITWRGRPSRRPPGSAMAETWKAIPPGSPGTGRRWPSTTPEPLRARTTRAALSMSVCLSSTQGASYSRRVGSA